MLHTELQSSRYWLFTARVDTVNITHPKIVFDEELTFIEEHSLNLPIL